MLQLIQQIVYSLEIRNDMHVVDDMLPHVDGRTVRIERTEHRSDGTLDSGAEASRLGKQHLLRDATPAEAIRGGLPHAGLHMPQCSQPSRERMRPHDGHRLTVTRSRRKPVAQPIRTNATPQPVVKAASIGS